MTQMFQFRFRQMLRSLSLVVFFSALLIAVVVNEARAEEAVGDSKVEAASTNAKMVTAPVAVEKVRAFRDGDTFTAELQTGSAWNGQDVQVQFFKDSVQVDVSGAFLNKGKQLIKVEDRAFKSVYATQYDATTVRARFTVKAGLSAKAFVGRFHAKRGASSVTFEISGDATDAKSANVKISDEAHTVAVVDENTVNDSLSAKLTAGANQNDSQQKSEAAAKINGAGGTIANGTGAGTVVASVGGDAKVDATGASNSGKKIDTNKLPENEIPVLSSVKAEKKSESNPFFRLLATLGVIAIALGAAAYGVKKMAARQGKSAQNTKINILTNHHLGPKKNLMIVQVAGETLLIGVTDHNITMLKTLALIDDEVPASVPQRFDHSMEDFVADEDEPIAMRGLDQIRDTVSSRLRNMRN